MVIYFFLILLVCLFRGLFMYGHDYSMQLCSCAYMILVIMINRVINFYSNVYYLFAFVIIYSNVYYLFGNFL
jgi:hypothetical protein